MTNKSHLIKHRSISKLSCGTVQVSPCVLASREDTCQPRPAWVTFSCSEIAQFYWELLLPRQKWNKQSITGSALMDKSRVMVNLLSKRGAPPAASRHCRVRFLSFDTFTLNLYRNCAWHVGRALIKSWDLEQSSLHAEQAARVEMFRGTNGDIGWTWAHDCIAGAR